MVSTKGGRILDYSQSHSNSLSAKVKTPSNKDKTSLAEKLSLFGRNEKGSKQI